MCLKCFRACSSAGKGQTNSSKSNQVAADVPDPTLCKCGSHMSFCMHPTCMSLYCKTRTCTSDKTIAFQSCQYGPDHVCQYRTSRGPYCNRHFDLYLARCADCEVVACDLVPCRDCEEFFCFHHLKGDSLCSECRWALREFQQDHNIELDYDSEFDDRF